MSSFSGSEMDKICESARRDQNIILIAAGVGILSVLAWIIYGIYCLFT